MDRIWRQLEIELYGTLKSEIAAAREAGKDSILEIEVNGCWEIRAQDQNLAPARSIFIFIVPPSFAILEERLRRRKTELETELKQRLDIAKSEVEVLKTAEYYDYWVSNPEGAVQQAVDHIQAIITAERCRIDAKFIETININALLSADCSD